ncbi:hypothetical protein JNB_15983 [Janibacter sp. HTCC2649]|nr:hypothetical protein [Janibacter sp. HTCC2649]EAP98479.1 hypothetical protein JNB_15983 [Janibacter sp. HTCC2649]
MKRNLPAHAAVALQRVFDKVARPDEHQVNRRVSAVLAHLGLRM